MDKVLNVVFWKGSLWFGGGGGGGNFVCEWRGGGQHWNVPRCRKERATRSRCMEWAFHLQDLFNSKNVRHFSVWGVPEEMCKMWLWPHFPNEYNITIGGSRGGGRQGPAPPMGPNSLVFMQFSGNFWPIIGRRPHIWGWRPLLWEILDPPLITLPPVPPSLRYPCPTTLITAKTISYIWNVRKIWRELTQMYTKYLSWTAECITAWHWANCHLRLSSAVDTDNVVDCYIKVGSFL